MPLTIQQWDTAMRVQQFIGQIVDYMDTATGWSDYETWATANSKYIPTDADFADWQVLQVSDAIPQTFIDFICALHEFGAAAHNASITTP